MTDETKFLNRPVYSLQTMLRAISNADNQILPVIPDGFYGPNTYASVCSFQNRYGLSATGVTDLETWKVITQQYTALHRFPVSLQLSSDLFLQDHQYHPYLYPVQAMIMALSKTYPEFPVPRIDGHFNKETKQGLRQIQQKTGLAASASLDQNTLHALVSLFLHTHGS